jgi:methylphosphotriester-DNA--protein-cysteine methyltransferase
VSYTLLGADGRPYTSDVEGQWGGHRRARIYGRLDCPSALRAIARGGYVRDRVFFSDEAAAIAAGYRPCAVCCPDRYRAWKHQRESSLRSAPATSASASGSRGSKSGPPSR